MKTIRVVKKKCCTDNRVIISISWYLWLLLAIYLLTSQNGVNGKVIKRRSIMDNINNGIKYAGQMLGINTASDVADLVAKAFAPKYVQNKQDSAASTLFPSTNTGSQFEQNNDIKEPFNPIGVLSGVLKVMGFDSGKLTALAINGLIFIAQMIGSAFTGNRHSNVEYTNTDNGNQRQNDQHSNQEQYSEGRQARSGSPIDWLLENRTDHLSDLLSEAQDRKLPEYLTETVNSIEKSTGDGDCIRLLICKSAPFIWGMQKAVTNRVENGHNTDDDNSAEPNHLNTFFKYLPNIDEYRQHGHKCEDRYAFCNTSKF